LAGSRRHRRPEVGQLQGVGTVVGFRSEISRIGGGQVNAGEQLGGHGHSAASELPGLIRVVAEEPDRRRAQRAQHLGGGGVVAFVLAMA
jgi:hypothetical protein